jgi:hypothetical protein
MELAVTSPSDVITCAKPGCDNTTTLAESGYIDGCGQVCPACFGPNEEDDREPPF